MLNFNVIFYINICRWFISAPEEKGPPIPIPPLKNDKYRRSTVLPYLDAYHYETERDLEEVYFTEHDLNRKLVVSSFRRLSISLQVFIACSQRNWHAKPLRRLLK